MSAVEVAIIFPEGNSVRQVTVVKPSISCNYGGNTICSLPSLGMMSLGKILKT